MNRIELYHNTVDLLFDAYNKGTLKHQDCTACAVGNICGTTESDIFECVNRPTIPWFRYFGTAQGIQKIRFIEDIQNFENTGYSLSELASIEEVFENSIFYRPLNDEEYRELVASGIHTNNPSYTYFKYINEQKGQYIGLCAVLDKLKEIHSTPEDISETSLTSLQTIAKEKLVSII